MINMFRYPQSIEPRWLCTNFENRAKNVFAKCGYDPIVDLTIRGILQHLWSKAMAETNKIATWRKVLAFILDLFGSFFLFGYVIGMITGDTTENGFSLNGLPAIILFALVILYFVGMGRYGGGTVFQRLLRAKG